MKRFVAVMMLMVMTVSLTACGGQESTYKAANKLLTKGKYADAAAKFEGLGSYEDASQMTMYAKALAAAENGNYDTAIMTFASLGSFKDCEQMETYYAAKKYMENEEYAYALELFNSNPLFKDSQEYINAIEEYRYEEVNSLKGEELFELFIVEKDGKYGIIDTTGKVMTPCELEFVGSDGKGFAAVEKNGKWGFIDTTGQLVIPCEWDDVAYCNGYFAVIKDEHLSIYGSDGNKVY